ncbi:XRE family transcriptional regulator [Neorhizobium lilium]|uniref:XRE family transcriptional regulator n=1 Tax=Neorhizobium lilium TaxID=2503024 RepID=A0A444LMH2_9HYPH|nr:helix-turn-helix transcriptional regulator [Neorhizobium lilium]RWX81472.1 XRE family transcriptional regulator [Neorhizobium lilium]
MSRRISKEEGPHPVDVHVGRRLRMRRAQLGMSQTTLGDQLGITFQQIQKYERGANRVSASMLHDIARVMETQIAYFFEDLPTWTLRAQRQQLAPSGIRAFSRACDASWEHTA